MSYTERDVKKALKQLEREGSLKSRVRVDGQREWIDVHKPWPPDATDKSSTMTQKASEAEYFDEAVRIGACTKPVRERIRALEAELVECKKHDYRVMVARLNKFEEEHGL